MFLGAQVSTSGGLENGLVRGEAMAAEVIQIFTQSPRQWKPYSWPPEVFEAYRLAAADHPGVRSTFSHATYLINLATTNEDIAEKSFGCLVENLASASLLGAAGVVLHIGSHLGQGLDAVLDRIAAALLGALDAAERRVGRPSCPLLLENAAGAGGTVGRSFSELGAVIEATGSDERLAVCIDTQHLFASGVSFASLEEADTVIAEIDRTVGLERLALVHMNDSKVPLGANRDRHENIGDGEIGDGAFSMLLGHPALSGLPAVLEVPGSGDGPRAEDIAHARQLVDAGVAARS
jgi:deoxyribonuclease IV